MRTYYRIFDILFFFPFLNSLSIYPSQYAKDTCKSKRQVEQFKTIIVPH